MLGVLVGFASPHVTADPNRAGPFRLVRFLHETDAKKKKVDQTIKSDLLCSSTTLSHLPCQEPLLAVRNKPRK